MPPLPLPFPLLIINKPLSRMENTQIINKLDIALLEIERQRVLVSQEM
jgi:hypothetical protein